MRLRRDRRRIGPVSSQQKDLRAFLQASQIDHDSLSMDMELEAARIMFGYAKHKDSMMHSADPKFCSDPKFSRAVSA